MRSKFVLSSALAAALLLGGLAPAALAANDSRQGGLVNVSAGDVDILNGVNLGVAANVVATVCGVAVPVAVLATQVFGAAGYECSGQAGDIEITQALPGDGAGTPAGGNNSRQAGLVNVSLGDVAILNDVNAAVAANVLVTACGLTVPIAILAAQAVGTAPFDCESDAGEILIDQS